MNELDSLRQEAETLKNAIRVSDRCAHHPCAAINTSSLPSGCAQVRLRHEPRAGHQPDGTHRQNPDAYATHTARPPGQDLRDALGQRLAEPCVCVTGRQADCLGLAHH